jgi:hypothetical protein
MRRQATNALKNEFSERLTRRPHSAHPIALVLASGVQPTGVERCDGPIGQTLHHEGIRRGQSSPGFERIRSGEDDIARDEQPVEAAALGGRKDGAERVKMAMDVRNAKEQHRLRPSGP